MSFRSIAHRIGQLRLRWSPYGATIAFIGIACTVLFANDLPDLYKAKS